MKTDLNSILSTVEQQLEKYEAMDENDWQNLYFENRGASFRMNEEYDCLLAVRDTLKQSIDRNLKKIEEFYN